MNKPQKLVLEENGLELCGAFLPQRERVAEKRVLSKVPKTMEEVSQGYGFILYETFLEHTDGLERVLKIDELQENTEKLVQAERA